MVPSAGSTLDLHTYVHARVDLLLVIIIPTGTPAASAELVLCVCVCVSNWEFAERLMSRKKEHESQRVDRSILNARIDPGMLWQRPNHQSCSRC